MVYPSVTLSGSEESFGADNCRYNVGRNEGSPRSERSFALLRMTHRDVLQCSVATFPCQEDGQEQAAGGVTVGPTRE